MSPARHVAISEALNAFAGVLAPAIVEKLCKGQLIYAGGDDLLVRRQADKGLKQRAGAAAKTLVDMAVGVQARTGQPVAEVLEAFLSTAEFLARPVSAARAADRRESERWSVQIAAE